MRWVFRQKVFEHFNAKGTEEFKRKRKCEIQINIDLARKLQFNASDHCDIKTIEGMLFDECETFLCEDSFAATIKEKWNI